MPSINVAQLKKKHGGPHQGWDAFLEYLFQNYEPKQFERSLWLHAFKATSTQPLNAVIKYYQKHDIFSNRPERFKYQLFDMTCLDVTHLERNMLTLLEWQPQGIGMYWTNNLKFIQGDLFEKIKPFLEKDIKLQENLLEWVSQPTQLNLPLLKWAMHKPDIFKPTETTLEKFLDRTSFAMSSEVKQQELIEDIVKPVFENHLWKIGKGVLHTCIRNRQNVVLQFLIEKGYGVHPKKSDGRELAWTCYSHNLPALQLLIDHGVNPNATFEWKNIRTNMVGGLIGFGELIHKQYEESISALLERGADLGQALDDIRPALSTVKDVDFHARFARWQAHFDKHLLGTIDAAQGKQTIVKPRL